MARRGAHLAALVFAAALAMPVWAQDAPAPETSAQTETQRLLEWIRDKTEERRPNFAAASSWGDFSDAAAAELAALVEADLAELRASFDPAALDAEGLVEFRVYEHQAERQLRNQALREQS